jgi:hypothetical protein
MRRLVHILWLVFLAVPCFAAQDLRPVTVASRVDKSRITIGDLIRYNVTVTHPKGVEVKTPGTGANLGGFDIRAYRVADPSERDGAVVSEVEYTISTFLTGEFVIPPLPVAYRIPGDTTVHVIATPSIKIVVESMKPSEAGDIRDVKPPLDIPRNWWLLAGQVGLVLLVLGAAVGVLLLVRRLKAGKGILPVRQEPPRPPHEIALEALDRLKASGLLAAGEIKGFYIELSEIVRRYIGGRYFVVAMEMTTVEVLEGLSRTGVRDDLFGLFESFFHRCDLVKFAKHRPGEPETDEAVGWAYDIVHRTKIEIAPIEIAPIEIAPVGGGPRTPEPAGAFPAGEGIAETANQREEEHAPPVFKS